MTDKELRFSRTFDDRVRVFKDDKVATPEEVVMRVCYLYLTCEKESDKEESAWFINRLNKKYKKQALMYIDFNDEYMSFVKSRRKKRDKINRIHQKRRHQKREDFSLTSKQWEETCNYFDYKCVYCGSDKQLTYDHFIPFSKGGGFGQDNILPCCSRCNSSKNNKDFKEWFRAQSFYSEDKEKLITDFIYRKCKEAAFL
jgi:5-methylcytosine-specific restriction endonuclease McrA